MFTEDILSEDNGIIKYYVNVDKFKLKEKYISKEIDSKKNIIIHFPFNINYEKNEIVSKYKNIKKISYVGFGDKDNKLPKGVYKSAYTRYGFRKGLSNVIYFIESSFPNIKVIEISTKDKTEISDTRFIFNNNDFNKLYNLIVPFNKDKKNQLDIIVTNFFASNFPDKFNKKTKKYYPGNITNYINEYAVNSNNLSKEDSQSIFELIKNNSQNDRKQIINTRNSLDVLYLEDILIEFEKKLSLKKITEQKWQQFFENNKFIFSQIFYTPQVFFASKSYAGGRDIFGKEGKFGDFLYKNKLTNNILIIEIKTHATKLLYNTVYRGKDVYPLSKELTGGINQILDHKQKLLNEYNTLYMNTVKNDENNGFSAFNPRCVIIIGSTTELKDKNKQTSFELFRNSIKDVEIITFDELLERIKITINIFKNDFKVNNSSIDLVITNDNKLKKRIKLNGGKAISPKEFIGGIK